ncbi:MAG: hypothetical protein OXN89_18130 [Bryobacterales bacterium]|nr:hypothetical protein [Bryobacterales bacterium]
MGLVRLLWRYTYTRGDAIKVMTGNDGNDGTRFDPERESNLFADPLPALRRAARAARARAIAISGSVATYRDGKLVYDTHVSGASKNSSSET